VARNGHGGGEGSHPRYTIATARPHDLPRLAAIELAAAALLAGHAPASVLSESTSVEDFRAARAEGRLWVALCDDEPVGFALVEMLADHLPHLEEIDVHPDHGQRGVGTALVRTVCDWASRSGFSELTLTTFRAVPWNMPFYARLGFEEIPANQLRPALAAIVDDETVRGLDPARRVAMRYRIRKRS
jgi:GNAT superfamily N-acetyltransferase